MDVFVDEICGKCKHHKRDGRDYICMNEDSECYGCSTMYRDCCADFEERQQLVFRDDEREGDRRWRR